MISWSITTEGDDYIRIPKTLRDELDLQGGEIITRLRIVTYIPEFYFPKSFANGILALDFLKYRMKVGGVEVAEFNPEGMLRDTTHGFAITVETGIKSTSGTLLRLRFYEDGTVNYIMRSVAGDSVYKAEMSMEKTLEKVRLEEGEIFYLKMKLANRELKYPIKTLSLEIGKEYKIYVDAEGQKTTLLLTDLRTIFGYDAIEKIQEKMKAGELKLMAKLEDGGETTTRQPRLEVTNEGLDITSIAFLLTELKPKYSVEEATEYLKGIGIMDEKLIDRIVDRYLEVMGQLADIVEATRDESILGLYDEFLIIEKDAPNVKRIQYSVKIDGEQYIIDIVEIDRVVESKYWPSEESYKIVFIKSPEAFNKFVDEIKACKQAMEQEGLKKVCLVFGKKILDDVRFDNYMQKLREALGGDTDWLETFNGIEQYESKG